MLKVRCGAARSARVDSAGKEKSESKRRNDGGVRQPVAEGRQSTLAAVQREEVAGGVARQVR